MPTAAEKLNTYRRDIDLVEFLEAEGFRLNPRKGSRRGRWVVLDDTNGARRLVVARSTGGTARYFNPEDDSDRGNVIDFVRLKLGVRGGDRDGWKGVFAYLDAYLGQPRPEPAGVRVPVPSRSPESASAPFRPAWRPYADTGYLLSRGLSERTLSAPEFEGRIFDLPHVDRYGRTHVNTAFPLEMDQNVVGVVIRNAGMNRIQGRKAGALWISRVLPDRPCRELFLCESPIDALSYHQLHPPERPGERVYVATAGSLTAGYPAALRALVERLRPTRLLLGNDHDVSGVYYNLVWLGSLAPPGVLSTPAVRVVKLARSVEFQALVPEVALPAVQARLRAWREQGRMPFSPVGVESGTPFDARPVVADGLTALGWGVPKEGPWLLRAERLLTELRGLGGWAEVKRPTEKDWNDELRASQVRKSPDPRPRLGPAG